MLASARIAQEIGLARTRWQCDTGELSRTGLFEALSQERDNLIMGLLELLSHRAKAEPVAASGHTADDS
jgi:hypothetical protein